MSIKDNYIVLKDGAKLYCDIYNFSSPVWIIAVHGIGEHCGRHSYITDVFDKKYNVFQFDLRGHGRSSGRKGYVDHFRQYEEDLHEIIQQLKQQYNMKRYVLLGHSMGALIVASYIQNGVMKDFYPERIFLSAPPVGVPGALGTLFYRLPKKVLNTLTNLPSIKLPGLVDLRYLSHDPKVYEDYINDDLNILKLHSKLLFYLINVSREVFSKPLSPKCPAFCAVGTGDRIVDPKAMIKYFSNVETDFKLKVISEAYHEMHKEIDQYRGPYFKFLEKGLDVF